MPGDGPSNRVAASPKGKASSAGSRKVAVEVYNAKITHIDAASVGDLVLKLKKS